MLCGTISKIEEIETVVKSLVTDNASLRAEIASRDEKITQLTDQVNRLDQASRSTSLRILGLPITTKSSTTEIIDSVYNNILLPTLEAAKQNGDISTILPAHFMIVNAFAIPAKKISTSSPVILKLQSEVIRSLVFKYKKTALPTMNDISSNRVRNQYSIFEDLSPATHTVFRSVSEDIRVKSAWSYGGQIRFKLHDSEFVYRMKSLTDTVDSVMKATLPTQPMNS